MSKAKIPLSQEIAKQIFPGTNPEIAEGEDGHILYDFKRLYPSKLGIFIPNEVEKSDYSQVFPRTFESYFTDIREEMDYLSRLLEIPIRADLPAIKIDCVFGKMMKPHPSGFYTLFRFDELLEPRKRMHLLCRANLNDIGVEDRLYILNTSISILNTNPFFSQEAYDITGKKYYYWIMKIDKVFFEPTEILAAMFAFTSKKPRK